MVVNWIPVASFAATSLVLFASCAARTAETQTAMDLGARMPAALASGVDPTTVVARVGDRELNLRDLLFRYANLPELQRRRYERLGGLEAFLEDAVANLAVVVRAEEMGLDGVPLYRDLEDLHRERIFLDLFARATALEQIDEETLRARYEEEKETRFTREPLVRARHILVTPTAEDPVLNESGDDAIGEEEAKAKAERLHRSLVEDGARFEEIARRYSEDVSALDGGDLGWIEPGALVPELQKRVVSTPVGGLSPVFRSPLGYHLVTVDERQTGGTAPFEWVRELLLQEIVGEKAQLLAPALQQARRDLVEGVEAESYPERLPW